MMKTDKYGDLWITGNDAKVFDGDFSKLLGCFLAPYVYTKDIPEFIRQKNAYNEKVRIGEIPQVGGFPPYYQLGYIEIEECILCSGSGCRKCYQSGWETKI